MKLREYAKIELTIVQVSGFLFASMMQQPKSMTLVNMCTVSGLAVQSTTDKPVCTDES